MLTAETTLQILVLCCFGSLISLKERVLNQIKFHLTHEQQEQDFLCGKSAASFDNHHSFRWPFQIHGLKSCLRPHSVVKRKKVWLRLFEVQE